MITLLALSVIVTLFIVYAKVNPFPVEYHLVWWHSLIHIQKITFGLLLIGLLSSINKPSMVLDILARYSFTIYFLHVITINNILEKLHLLINPSSNLGKILICLASIVLGIAVIVTFAVCMKKVFKKNTRMLIGC